ncbi:DNA repair protein [Aspergillus sclerotialis]|uniref:DNA repair protein n=1 Tax=Aspergillus sclerotialis TaxID=2070753 RepID=A0A3A2ZDV4_9EURO|nr:DNA repair protein [Aspergillus sclerotialis]
MLKKFIPKHSGIHRFATLALYRALLRQCRTLPKNVTVSGTVKQLIPMRFHRYKRLDSPSQIANAMKAGYEALDLLHSVSRGSKRDARRISKLINESESRKQRSSEMQRQMTEAKLAIPKTASQIRREEAIRFQESTAKTHPDATPILSRPRPVVSGKRRVPVFVNARGIPMLRIKKPQPRILSGIIRSKLTRRERWVNRENALAVDILFTKDEDNWDKLTVSQDPVPWTKEVWEALQQTKRTIKNNDIKNSEMAKAMWNVVLRERELAAKEEAAAKGGLPANDESVASGETSKENLTAKEDLAAAKESQNAVPRQPELQTKENFTGKEELVAKEESPAKDPTVENDFAAGEKMVAAEEPQAKKDSKTKEDLAAAEDLWNVILRQQELEVQHDPTTKAEKERLSHGK